MKRKDTEKETPDHEDPEFIDHEAFEALVQAYGEAE